MPRAIDLNASFAATIGSSDEPVTRSRRHRVAFYDYWYCLGRASGKKPNCPQKYIPADTVNAAVEQYFYALELGPERIKLLETLLHDGIDLALRALGKQTQHHRNRLVQLERERDKLLHLFYEDAIETDQLKKEQNRIKKEKAAATRAINAISGTRDEILAKLDRVLDDLRTCGDAYNKPDTADVGRSRPQCWKRSSSVTKRLCSDNAVVDSVATRRRDDRWHHRRSHFAALGYRR